MLEFNIFGLILFFLISSFAFLRGHFSLFTLCFSAPLYDLHVFSIAGFGFSIFTIFALIFTSYIFTVKIFSKSKNFINGLNVLLLIFGAYLIISKTFPLFAGDVTVLPYTSDYTY